MSKRDCVCVAAVNASTNRIAVVSEVVVIVNRPCSVSLEAASVRPNKMLLVHCALGAVSVSTNYRERDEVPDCVMEMVMLPSSLALENATGRPKVSTACEPLAKERLFDEPETLT